MGALSLCSWRMPFDISAIKDNQVVTGLFDFDDSTEMWGKIFDRAPERSNHSCP